MRLVKPALVGIFALSLSACPGDDTTRDTAVTTDTVGMTGTTGTTGAAGTAQRQDQMEGMERIDLSGINGGTASGEASLAPDGQNTRVMVTLTGATPGEKQGHIHQGTCNNIGPVRFPLQPVNVQQGGTGSSTSTVNAPPQQIMEGEHLIAYHESGGDPGRPVVCGEIRRGGLGL